jgi:hypothetical protein
VERPRRSQVLVQTHAGRRPNGGYPVARKTRTP